MQQGPAKDGTLKFSPDQELQVSEMISRQISFEYINGLNDRWVGVKDGVRQTSMNHQKEYEGQGEMWKTLNSFLPFVVVGESCETI